MNEPFVIHIDEPADRIFRKPRCTVRGWYMGPGWINLSKLDFRIGETSVAWRTQVRHDVIAKHVESSVAGFLVDLDLSQWLYAIRDGELCLTATSPHAPEMNVQFSVAPGVAARCLAAAAGV